MKYISKGINITLNLNLIKIGSISPSSTLISKCPHKVLTNFLFKEGTVNIIFISSLGFIFEFILK